jgi:subtilase family serine protease
MMHFTRFLAAILMLTAIVPPVQQGIAAGGPPETVEARPPIHVRGKATIAPAGYTPAQIRHAYGFDSVTNDGTRQIIAIVDAYDDPAVASDLQKFVNTFGLQPMYGLPNTSACTIAAGPHPCFQKVYAQGKPRANSGWALEISLDVQWAHAIAPGADILLVEAKNGFLSSLLSAVDLAVSNGARAVSMSWGGSDFSSESLYDFHFNHTGVTFTAASGDSGTGVIWPAASPYVVGVGGTTLPLDNSGNLTGPETAWSGSGGGISAYEYEPGYQSSYPIGGTNGYRGIPDVAYDADPSTGVSVYDSIPYQGQTGWFQVGGTSVGAPQWAAFIVLVDQTRATVLSSNNLSSSSLYNAATGAVYASNYRDITSGSNGSCGSICTAQTSYDWITGLGTPRAGNLVPYLATAAVTTLTSPVAARTMRVVPVTAQVRMITGPHAAAAQIRHMILNVRGP